MADLGARPSVLGEIHKLWHPLTRLGLGVRIAVGFASIPYGRFDGEPSIGERSPANPGHLVNELTPMPSIAFVSSLRLTDDLRVMAALGATFMLATEMGWYRRFPMRSGGLAMDLRLKDTESGALRARLGFDWITYPVGGLSPALFCPTVGLSLDL